MIGPISIVSGPDNLQPLTRVRAELGARHIATWRKLQEATQVYDFHNIHLLGRELETLDSILRFVDHTASVYYIAEEST